VRRRLQLNARRLRSGHLGHDTDNAGNDGSGDTQHHSLPFAGLLYLAGIEHVRLNPARELGQLLHCRGQIIGDKRRC
jgi:hypothetical protein